MYLRTGSPINWRHPLTKGIVSWWKVLPHWNGGTVFRDLAGRNHGTLTGMDPATDWVKDSPRGGFGSLNFDGVNDHVVVPVINLGDKFTIIATIKDGGLGNVNTILANSNSGGTVDGLRFTYNSFVTTDHKILVSTGNGVSNASVTSTAVVELSWQQIAITIDRAAGTGLIYHNGLDVTDTGTVLTDFANNQSIHIAQMKNNNFEMKGGIEEVAIYTRYLSKKEVSTRNQLSKKRFNPMLNWVDAPIARVPTVTTLPKLLEGNMLAGGFHTMGGGLA